MNFAEWTKLCNLILVLLFVCGIHAQERPSTFSSGSIIDSIEFIKYRNLAQKERKTRSRQVLIYDSLQVVYATRTKSDSLQAESLLDYIKDAVAQWNVKTATRLLRELEELSAISGNARISQKVDYARGLIAFKDFRYKEASGHFRIALQKAQALNDEEKAIMSKLWIGGSLASYGKPDSAVAYVFDVIDYMSKRNRYHELSMAYSFLAYGYLRTGNIESAAKNYILMEKACRNFNDQPNEISALLGQSQVRIYQRRFAEADSLLRKAYDLCKLSNFTEGLTRMYLQRGEWCTAQNKTVEAEKYFDSAEVYVKKLNINILNISLSGMRMQNKFRAGQIKQADSLALATAKQMAATLPAELKESLVDRLQSTNLFTEDEAKSFKQYMMGNGDLETLPVVNPFTGASPRFDSSFTLAFNKQVKEMETKYQTRQKEDSLRLQQQNLLVSRQQLNNRNILLGSSGLVILLAAILAFLQYSFRKRAEENKRIIEKAKDQIEFLTREMHHQIKNNMGIISRFVEVAEKDGGGLSAISSLRSRVNAIHSLHTTLYENDLSSDVDLQEYIDKLIPSLKRIYTMNLKLDYTVPPGARLPMDTANKIGLILTELCTNSYKYAFDNVLQPEVHFSFEAIEDQWKFQYADNGQGLPLQLKDSYGMKLIKGLSAQLNGTCRIYNDPGFHFELFIPNLHTA